MQNDEALLKVLNKIGKSENIHFHNLKQAIEKDNLPKFVNLLFQDKEIASITQKIKPYSEKINDIIKYLSQIRKPNEYMFDVQFFNFKKKKYASSSSVLFYTKFLNIYFLKQAKSKMLERMTTIIFGNLNHEDYFYKIYKNDTGNKINPYENENILLQWKSYLALANFVKVRSTHFKLKENNNDLFYFGKNIPLIINQNYLEQYKSKFPDVCYYHLQFIFDTLDNKEFVYRFHENILKTERIIKKIKWSFN